MPSLALGWSLPPRCQPLLNIHAQLCGWPRVPHGLQDSGRGLRGAAWAARAVPPASALSGLINMTLGPLLCPSVSRGGGGWIPCRSMAWVLLVHPPPARQVPQPLWLQSGLARPRTASGQGRALRAAPPSASRPWCMLGPQGKIFWWMLVQWGAGGLLQAGLQDPWHHRSRGGQPMPYPAS